MLGYPCLISSTISYKVDFFLENVHFIHFNTFTCLLGFVIHDLDLMHVVTIRNCMTVHTFPEFTQCIESPISEGVNPCRIKLGSASVWGLYNCGVVENSG